MIDLDAHSETENSTGRLAFQILPADVESFRAGRLSEHEEKPWTAKRKIIWMDAPVRMIRAAAKAFAVIALPIT